MSQDYPFARWSSAARENYGGDGEPDADPLAGGCGYSRPFLFLDMMWNLSFVLVSFFVLLTTVNERPSTPLRLWVLGYALQCLLHVGFVWDEYQRRSLDDDDDYDCEIGGRKRVSFLSALTHKSVMKKLESVNTIVSSVWWVFGFYWIVIGGQPLLHESPRLYWLSVSFLAFDVFFMIFCISMACIVFFFLFCCLPIIATVAYAMAVRERASENDIRSLPKYTYQLKNTFEDDVNLTALPSYDNSSKTELFLSPEDSECCICLYKYTDGIELCRLPCNHHFHYRCVTKWLRINATCPLCKFSILRGDTLV